MGMAVNNIERKESEKRRTHIFFDIISIVEDYFKRFCLKLITLQLLTNGICMQKNPTVEMISVAATLSGLFITIK
ncbi:CLUMA_CG003225, isoform A [Clunio marinus]|uniref:CLUMA_CG003225, isoform A n=1 Tax=Clunio marinus TaxID=568069 RepID=A0A1J1HTH9_9DIPT|nr:CLUMA_CG003225, isoform A [Clunio marinus]